MAQMINVLWWGHCSVNRENMITTDACNTGLGATLLQKQIDGELKPIAFAICHLEDAKKRYAIVEVDLVKIVWALEHLRCYIYRKPSKLYTDQQSLKQFYGKTAPINFRARDKINYLSHHSSMDKVKDTPFDEECVINATTCDWTKKEWAWIKFTNETRQRMLTCTIAAERWTRANARKRSYRSVNS